jgi:hypothetical protein
MGYFLKAFVGTTDALRKYTPEFQHARLVSLTQGMALIPLTDDLHAEVGSEDEAEPFETLSPAAEQWAQRMSSAAPIAYIEAEFFGGIGGQRAVVWSGGLQVIEPIHSKHAINQALRFLGVQVGDAHDEFDAVGLGRHRNTRDWTEG